MNRGWQHDSYRHALAAKGVHTTNKYYSSKANPRFVVRDGKIYDLRPYVKPVQEPTTAFIQQEPIETEPAKEVTRKNRLPSKPNRMKLRPGEEYVADEEFEKLVRQFEEEGEYKENPNINRLYKADKIDLNKYQGKWKQVSVKNEPWYQKGLSDIKAEYKLRKDGTVQVINTSTNEDGETRKVVGTAKSVSDDNRKLEVNFGFGRTGEYNIKKVNKDYTEATVQGGSTTWKLKKEKRSYKATYAPSDIPLITADGVGTVGASAVAVAPLAVAAVMIYGGAVLGKKAYKKAKD